MAVNDKDNENVSLLEKSLSLSRNGGVYYAGARVPSDPRSAVLFVGLGGSGADTLIRIKNEVKNRMLLPKNKEGATVSDAPKNIGFLAFDTDDGVADLAYGTAKFDPFKSEFQPISVGDLPTVIEDVKKAKHRGDASWQWFDDDVDNVAGSHGAGGIRQIGRMLLAYNMENVINAVNSKIASLTLNNPALQELIVYVFSGMSGGTGAGTFLDMAYILRKLAKAKVPNVNVMGYLIMSDVNELSGGKTENLRSNCFACLKELDYWMACGEHKDRYRQKFPNGFELNERDTPFDFCHLLDASDKSGHNFSYNKILTSVAESAFAYIAGEQGGGATSTMSALYSNVRGYITTMASQAPYPGCYNYLSLGSAKIEIPYTEISTLIAARVFARLDKDMFQNRPTQDQFNNMAFRGLEITETAIRTALYGAVKLPRPILQEQSKNVGFSYNDIWPGNSAYNAVHQWLATFQRDVQQQAANHPAYLEGKLREFIAFNLKNKSTGPIYLKHFFKSNEAYSLFNMLDGFKNYCSQLQLQCVAQAKPLSDNLQMAYAQGAGAGFGSKGKALTNYLQVLDAWYRNEESAFLNEKLVEIIDTIQGRIRAYYDNILKPLADILVQLPQIFRDNENYIIVKSQKPPVDADNILIDPISFERQNKTLFDQAVLKAEDNFLDSLLINIKKWIGRDIDEVDSDIAGSPDVAGFISDFISENFSNILTINMETVMTAKLSGGQSLKDYVYDRVKELIDYSYPMYKESNGLFGTTEQFAMISVPKNCPQIYAGTVDYINSMGMSKKIQVKQSEELSRMYITKIASGYPLYSNAYIQGMEEAYENLMATNATRMGKHLYAEWMYRLPSPYIQLAWKVPYKCQRTLNRNEKYKKYFEICKETKVVRQVNDTYMLFHADEEMAMNVGKENLTSPTILGKLEQFDKIKQTLWKASNAEALNSCSTYMAGQEDGLEKNVKENILRFPLVLDSLEKECILANKINVIEEELHYPMYYSMARICGMIYIEKVTGNSKYKRTGDDPFPIALTEGHSMSPDYREYQIYQSFCRVINSEIKEEIELQYKNLDERKLHSPAVLEQFIDDIHKWQDRYNADIKKANDAKLFASKEDRPEFDRKIEFYKGCIEEMDRMLPYEEKPVESSAQPIPPAQPAQPVQPLSAVPPVNAAVPPVNPRYLNPATWQPIANPTPGQQVFDTELKQMIVYTPEPVAAPRYLDAATWQPIANPTPGQQVFDTELKQVIVYMPEPAAAPRYLDPATWQPIANPTPGQQVFDTITKQMITYYPNM